MGELWGLTHVPNVTRNGKYIGTEHLADVHKTGVGSKVKIPPR